ncbi:MAG TPA: hypothetical protein VIM96_06790 [Pseudomonadales bacterium]
MNCNAGEFTVNPVFSAAPGSPPFCAIGSFFDVVVEVNLSGSNTDRQDIGFFVGQAGNDPGNTGGQCSVATFPTTSAPVPPNPNAWTNNDGDACGDYIGGANATTRINQIRVDCRASTAGFLEVPYLLTYWQNNGNVCIAESATAGNVVSGSKSKCNKGVAEVSGVVAVNAGAWVDITKATNPGGQSQAFNYTATITSTSDPNPKVVARVGSTYYPATIAAASGSTTFTLTDGQTARVFIKALAANQTLTITEQATTGWDTTATINCSSSTGVTPTVNNANRSLAATLNTTNYSAACTITNTKLPSVTVTKISHGDIGTFTFTGTNNWAAQNITTTTPSVGVSGALQYLPYSTSTEITKTALAGFRMVSISCSGMGAGGTAVNDLPNRQVTLDAAAMAPGSDITCTFTTVRQRDFSVRKNLSPGTDTGLFIMNANGTLSPEAGHGALATTIVDVGSTVNFSESAGTNTNLANYSSTYSCSTIPITNGIGTSGSLTMPNRNIICVLSNTRRSATLALKKTWVNAKAGDAATVQSSGFINNATSGSSVSTGNNTTTGSAVTVYSGESGSISETFSVGNASDYTKVVTCTSSLSGNTLTIAPGDTAIECTYTNTGAPQLAVNKTIAVVDDGISTANDKSIPGARMRYTITLDNTSSFASADAVVIKDAIPANVSYQGGSIVVDGTPQGDNTGDGDQADYNVTTPGAITVNKGTFGPSTTTTITFEVTVD